MAGKRGTYTAFDRDQVQAWKSAIAATRHERRARRGKRAAGLAKLTGPGMVRVRPPTDHPAGQDGGEAQEGTTE
jgi:hypothetical protein